MLRRAALVGTLSLVAPSIARAQERPREVRVTMLGHWGWDLGWLGVSAGLGIGGIAIQPRASAQVAPLDGEGHRAWNPDIGTASDVVLWGGLGVSVGAAFLVEAVGHRARGWRVIRAPLVLSEAAMMAFGLVSITKSLGSVCRPRAWRDETASCESAAVDDRRSFPSGHTAPLAAMAGASLGLWLFPSRVDDTAGPLFATTLALAGTNMVLRVAAGAHSWVDTSVGFAGGFALGLATAALHTRRISVGPASAGTGLTLAGTF